MEERMSVMQVRFWLVVGWVVFLMLAGGPAAVGYVLNYDEQGRPLRWDFSLPHPNTNLFNSVTKKIRYFIAADAYSEANREAELNAVRASFGQWESIAGTQLGFEEGGLLHGAVDLNPQDNTNLVYWLRTTTRAYGGTIDLRNVVAFTFWDPFNDNSVAEADIVLNGVDFRWAPYPADDGIARFIESVLVHEIGHFLGFAHSPLGSATMYPFGAAGLDPGTGLSSDEIAGVRDLYGTSEVASGAIQGKVLRDGTGLNGAIVTVSSGMGEAIAATVSRPDGSYRMSGLPLGSYQIWANPLAPHYVISGGSLASGQSSFATRFQATRPIVREIAGTTALDIPVVNLDPPFSITRIRALASHPDAPHAVTTAPVQLRRGQSAVVGVYSPNLPTANASFRVSGEGVEMGDPIYDPPLSGQLRAISALVHVSADAKPGMRSLIVETENGIAYANGFVDIVPDWRDDNFDNFPDEFQRRYFPVFTAAEAGPAQDPDGDGFPNRHEYETGTDPTDSGSGYFEIQSVRLTYRGASVTWRTVPGRRYTLWRKGTVAGSEWQQVWGPAVATDSTYTAIDGAVRELQFYRVEME